MTELDKGNLAEIVLPRQGYTEALEILSDEERAFFVIEKGYQTKYRRVEINALTTPELLNFIRSKIPQKAIVPDVETLREYNHRP